MRARRAGDQERGRRSFVVALMVNPFTLPALGGALLASVAIGVHLGESAIGQINPAYFKGPAIHPRDRGAAIDPNEVRQRPTLYSEHYGWEEGRAARAEDCGDCEALAARDAYARDYSYSAEVPYFGGPAEPVRAETVVEPAVYFEEEEAPFEEEVVEPEGPVVRYAHYPIEEQAPAAEPSPYPDKFDKE